jgi:hypothetical protein
MATYLRIFGSFKIKNLASSFFQRKEIFDFILFLNKFPNWREFTTIKKRWWVPPLALAAFFFLDKFCQLANFSF